jgi:hypothetical protein
MRKQTTNTSGLYRKKTRSGNNNTGILVLTFIHTLNPIFFNITVMIAM